GSTDVIARERYAVRSEPFGFFNDPYDHGCSRGRLGTLDRLRPALTHEHSRGRFRHGYNLAHPDLRQVHPIERLGPISLLTGHFVRDFEPFNRLDLDESSMSLMLAQLNSA